MRKDSVAGEIVNPFFVGIVCALGLFPLYSLILIGRLLSMLIKGDVKIL